MWVKDLFFFHEHPRVINYIEFSIILSPYLGPLITSFIVSGTTWRWSFWVCTILACIAWLLVFLLDETLFDRNVPAVPRGSYFSRLLGIQQAKSWGQRSLLRSLSRPLITITKLPVLTILVYYFLNFAWVIGVNTTVAIWLTNLYGFSPRDLGKLIRAESLCPPTQVKTHQVTSTSSASSESCLDGWPGTSSTTL